MKKAFTLAEVLITLAIIGVVAAIAIPSVINNTQQQEFRTGLKKAVSALNKAIALNVAIDGETPYDNANTYGYFMKHMSIVERTLNLNNKFKIRADNNKGNGVLINAAFYTPDGMRYEFNTTGYNIKKPLYETPGEYLCGGSKVGTINGGDMNSSSNKTICGGCGSKGLINNYYNTTKNPCLIMVDVNGDRKPNPANINCKGEGNAKSECLQPYKYSDPLGIKLTDIFTLMVTDKEVLPYGVAAQRAMYYSQKKRK